MPFEHTIEEQNRLLVIHGTGAGSFAEAEDSVRRAIMAAAEGKIPPGYGILINVDETALMPTTDEAIRIAQLIALLQSCLRRPIAIVAATEGKVAPARLIVMYLSGLSTAVQAFNSAGEARAWLYAHNKP